MRLVPIFVWKTIEPPALDFAERKDADEQALQACGKSLLIQVCQNRIESVIGD